MDEASAGMEYRAFPKEGSVLFRKKFKKVCVLQRRACNKFKRNYLENYNDSEHVVKTKNAPFFMIFPNISFFKYYCNLLYQSFNYNFAKSLRFKICVLFSKISRRYTAFFESEESYKCQIWLRHTFLPQKGLFLDKNRTFATFRFNT